MPITRRSLKIRRHVDEAVLFTAAGGYYAAYFTLRYLESEQGNVWAHRGKVALISLYVLLIVFAYLAEKLGDRWIFRRCERRLRSETNQIENEIARHWWGRQFIRQYRKL